MCMTPLIDNNGCSVLQAHIRRTLVVLLSSYVAALERPVFVGTNQFFYYKKGEPRAVVSPDVYTIDGIAGIPIEVRSWKTWEPGARPPTLAIEVVSDEYRKDYADTLVERYQQLGVQELVRYDPTHRARRSRELLAHFVREESGQLVRRPVFGDRVQLVSYDLWLVPHANDVLRIGTGFQGATLWPTPTERAAAEAERAAAADERAAEADERAAAAEAELERLRAELAALRGE